MYKKSFIFIIAGIVTLILMQIAGCYTPLLAAEVLVNIDKTTQEMAVSVDGTEQYRWPVSTGKRGYDTPSGTYTATSMNEMWYSKQWDNAPMPHSVFFMTDGHAIHGTDDVKHLGTAASHGCVRLSKENAEILYKLVEENGLESTQVVLDGEPVYEEFPDRLPDPELEAQPEYPQPENVEPEYNDPYGDYGMPEPGFRGFEFDGPGFQFQFKLDRRHKRERRWRRRWYD